MHLVLAGRVEQEGRGQAGRDLDAVAAPVRIATVAVQPECRLVLGVAVGRDVGGKAAAGRAHQRGKTICDDHAFTPFEAQARATE